MVHLEMEEQHFPELSALENYHDNMSKRDLDELIDPTTDIARSSSPGRGG